MVNRIAYNRFLPLFYIAAVMIIFLSSYIGDNPGNSGAGSTNMDVSSEYVKSSESPDSSGSGLSDFVASSETIEISESDSYSSSIAGSGSSSSSAETSQMNEYDLKYVQAPAGNPLKGFMPFKGNYAAPHSMEWWYIPLSDVMNGSNSFTWEQGMEPVLDEISERGNQAAIRVYIDYSGNPAKMPQFLVDEGVALFPYTAFGGGQNPDYSDEKLVKALERFVAAFGAKYDGDPRIAFVTCGLIGHWGEWHTYPDDERMASADVQNRIFTAYDNAFNKTKILARYPDSADVAKMNIGFHDDSFVYDTLAGESWHFMSRMDAAGAGEKWKTQPIGGEIYPDLQNSIWTDTPSPDAEDIDECIEVSHATWMMAYHVFADFYPDTVQYTRALDSSRKMGYDLYVTKATIKNSGSNLLDIGFTLGNKGVAPFYYNWDVEIGIADGSNSVKATWKTSCKLSGILPGDFKLTMLTAADCSGLKPGTYKLLLKAKNPLTNGKPLLFSNSEQNKDVKNWLTLGTIKIK